MIYTFWDGPMPGYIKLCLATWKQPYTMLTYENLNQYTDIDAERLKRYTLPQQSDYIRVHVLRDNGGWWLDADTIMITGKLPETDMVGDPLMRTNSIGVLHSVPEMFKEWAQYQDDVLNAPGFNKKWSVMGNDFTDKYVKEHEDIRIYPIDDFYPETYMIDEYKTRFEKYLRFYFSLDYHLSDIRKTDLLMLHNSWTPGWYKNLTESDVLDLSCTMSNILREVTQCNT
jgi:hypothetical protein